MKEKLTKKNIVTAVIAAAAVLAVFFAFRYLTVTKPYNLAYSVMPADGEYSICILKDGSAEISWPEAEYASGYTVEITAGDSRETIFKQTVSEGLSCAVPEFPVGRTVNVSINSYREYKVRGKVRARAGETPVEYSGTITVPSVIWVDARVDADAKTVSVEYGISDADDGLVKGSPEGVEPSVLGAGTEGMILGFGDGGEILLPSGGKSYVVTVYPRITDGKFVIMGEGASVALGHDSFFGTDLDPVITPSGNGTYTISWNETKGNGYCILQYSVNSGKWLQAGSYTSDDERVYTTADCSDIDVIKYRVAALSEAHDGTYAALSEDIVIFGSVDSRYCTIWPNRDLTLFSDPGLTADTGKIVPAMKALCVIDESDGAFRVRYDGTEGYIDSNYCLINLAEYLGNLCSYDITNSYASKYLVHEFEIPKVSGTIVVGYESVRLSEGVYLVPYLYPCAKRLASAAKDALTRDYKLKIYDAYRPNAATKFLYSKCSAILGNELPDETYSGVPIEELELPEGYILPGEIVPETSEPKKEERETQNEDEPGGESAEDLENTEASQEPEEKELRRLTYRDVLLSSKYSLHYFIANGKSKHNYGIAIDITLEDLASGQELVMQTSMHDLSGYSIREKNNKNAKLLSDIMTGAGYQTLVSEWWHFNDTENMDGLSPSLMTDGVSAECWMYDGSGWKYRKPDGSYYTNAAVNIDGVVYSFSSGGYVEE